MKTGSDMNVIGYYKTPKEWVFEHKRVSAEDGPSEVIKIRMNGDEVLELDPELDKDIISKHFSI